jgi:mRNA-degrading endonuclease RelE of RelBE toxin-antitoxin system
MKKIEIIELPEENPPFSFRIHGLGIETCVIKVKKITSNNFKGRGSNSGFRLVYAWFPDKRSITLIELYHKNEKEMEDRKRIRRYFSS